MSLQWMIASFAARANGRLAALWLGAMLSVAVASPAAARLSVLGLFRNQAIVEVDGRQYVLKVGRPGPPGIKLIAADSKQAVIEIDGIQSTYGIGSEIAADYGPPPAGASVIIAPDTQGMYFTDGSINGYTVRFLVDTGASDIAMNRHQARRMGIDYRLDGKESLTQTASGNAKAYAVVLKKVTVGGISLDNVDALVVDGDSPTEILLGGSFLNRIAMQRNGQILQLIKK